MWVKLSQWVKLIQLILPIFLLFHAIYDTIEYILYQEEKRMKTTKHELNELMCPVCGKLATEVRKYTDGSKNYIHVKRFHSYPFPHYAVEKSCYVKAQANT